MGSSIPLIVKLVLPVALAFAIHRYLFLGVDAPPSDFGSGSMFDLIARRYDAINRVMALGMDIGWRRRMARVVRDSQMVRQASSSSQASVSPQLLDLATGTADVALLLREEIPSATIVGVDPSANMLQVGREKVQKAGWDDSISLQLADAQDLSSALTTTPPSFYDAATMAFGIRNVPDRNAALCQIHRLLKDQAQFCILEFSEPDDSFGVLGIVARWFIRYVIPGLGGILSGAPREYWHLQNSIKDFPSPKDFIGQMEALECPVASAPEKSDSEDTEKADESGDVARDEDVASKKVGTFRLVELIHMSFGSVQLYVMTVLK